MREIITLLFNFFPFMEDQWKLVPELVLNFPPGTKSVTRVSDAGSHPKLQAESQATPATLSAMG